MSFFSFLSGPENAGVKVIGYVDLNRYTGTWYEIARFPNSFERGLKCATATYTLRDDGRISVLNKGHKINKHMQDHEKVIDESKICLWVLVLILFGFVNHIWKI